MFGNPRSEAPPPQKRLASSKIEALVGVLPHPGHPCRGAPPPQTSLPVHSRTSDTFVEVFTDTRLPTVAGPGGSEIEIIVGMLPHPRHHCRSAPAPQTTLSECSRTPDILVRSFPRSRNSCRKIPAPSPNICVAVLPHSGPIPRQTSLLCGPAIGDSRHPGDRPSKHPERNLAAPKTLNL